MKLEILRAAFLTPMPNGKWGLPLVIWGPPGIAKTAAWFMLVKSFNCHLEHLCPGKRGEGAFGVTPFPKMIEALKKQLMVMSYPPPEWVTKLLNATPGGQDEEVGLVFVDEINTASGALQAALLGALHEREIGGHELGLRVRVMGAANPVGQSAGGWDLAAAVANRSGHMDWEVTADEFAAYLLGGAVDLPKVDLVAEEKRVMEAWPKEVAEARGLGAAFLRRRPELLHKMPADGDPRQGRAWPSPRTWEMALLAMASAKIHKLSPADTDEFVGAFIGAEVAGEFLSWIEQVDLPDPAELLDEKVKFEHNPERLDRTEAVLGACAALVVPAKAEKRHPRSLALWKLMGEIADDAKDIVVPAMTSLIAAGLQKHKEAVPVLAKLHAVVTAAGVRK